MTTLRKADGSETSSIKETMEVMQEYHFTEDRVGEETQHHKNTRKTIEEPINTSEEAGFSRMEMRQTIISFSDKKAPGIDGIKLGIFLRTFNTFPEMVTAIYNQCLERGCFP
jgi:hypothetical protein